MQKNTISGSFLTPCADHYSWWSFANLAFGVAPLVFVFGWCSGGKCFISWIFPGLPPGYTCNLWMSPKFGAKKATLLKTVLQFIRDNHQEQKINIKLMCTGWNESPTILSLNESHSFLKSPRLNPGCRNMAVLTYQKNHSRGCLTWKFMVSLFGCIFYDPGIRTWWCSVAKGMFQKVTTWWNLGKRSLKLPVFRVSCSQRESKYGVYIAI